jgi:hypothetical protein
MWDFSILLEWDITKLRLHAKESKDTWTVPVGGGVGRLVHVGKQPIDLQLQAFDNVETPQFGAEW